MRPKAAHFETHVNVSGKQGQVNWKKYKMVTGSTREEKALAAKPEKMKKLVRIITNCQKGTGARDNGLGQLRCACSVRACRARPVRGWGVAGLQGWARKSGSAVCANRPRTRWCPLHPCHPRPLFTPLLTGENPYWSKSEAEKKVIVSSAGERRALPPPCSTAAAPPHARAVPRAPLPPCPAACPPPVLLPRPPRPAAPLPPPPPTTCLAGCGRLQRR